ncbi:MAG: U32 family peptidase [Clostridiales bacterium]|nr:U32 family peptidase [Clostridiales bacterium]
MKKCELLAPAGNFEKFEIALDYGADAIYMGGKKFGLRTMAGNLDNDELKSAIARAHAKGVRVYITVNIFGRDSDFEELEEYIIYLQEINVDAVIVADPGILSFVRQKAPNLEVHLSTQANTMNSYTANMWHDMGVKRIVLARELSLNEIATIKKKTPDSLELEVFVHGSMCMAYSGRCAISNYLTSRDANRGHCAQPCRWEYTIQEGKRDGELFTVQEDETGMYFFNSKDLNMMSHLKPLLETGVDGLKIEGRMKSELYIATITSAYKKEINSFYDNPTNYEVQQSSKDQLYKATYRPYTTGFYFGNPEEEGQNVDKSKYIRQWDYIGKVLEVKEDCIIFKEYNPFKKDETYEILHPDGSFEPVTILSIVDDKGKALDEVKSPKQVVSAKLSSTSYKNSIIRKKLY